jgi:hypothetical protein
MRGSVLSPAVATVVRPRPLVLAAISIGVNTVAAALVVTEFPYVTATIRPLIHALAVLAVVQPLTVVRVAVDEGVAVDTI